MKNKAMRVFSIVCLLSLSQETPSLASPETPAQFVARYYKAVTESNAPDDTRDFLSARVKAKGKALNPMVEEKIAMFEKTTKPNKVRVISNKMTPGKAELELEAAELPKRYQEMAKDAKSWSFKGSMVLVEEDKAWKVDKDIWTFSSSNKVGKSSEILGIAGADDDKRFAAVGNGAPLPNTNDFEGQVRRRLMDASKNIGEGKVYALISVGQDGTILGLKVGGDAQHPQAEKQISQLLASVQPFKPLPAKYQTQRNIWMFFDWSAGGAMAVSGPYFSSAAHPSWLRQKVGLN